MDGEAEQEQEVGRHVDSESSVRPVVARCGRSLAPSRRRRRRSPRRPGTGSRRGSGRCCRRRACSRTSAGEQGVEDRDMDRPGARDAEDQPGDALRDRPVQTARDEAVAGLAGARGSPRQALGRASSGPVPALDPHLGRPAQPLDIRSRVRRQARAVADPEPGPGGALVRQPAHRPRRGGDAGDPPVGGAADGKAADVRLLMFSLPNRRLLTARTPRAHFLAKRRPEHGNGGRRRHSAAGAAQPAAGAAGSAEFLFLSSACARGWRGCCARPGSRRTWSR